MHIDAIDAFDIDDRMRDLVVARLGSGGLYGVGGATVSSLPIDSEQWVDPTIAFIERCVPPTIMHCHVDHSEGLSQILKSYRGHSLAKGAVDCAWHDLAARIAGVPLWKFLGGVAREIVAERIFARRDSIEELLAVIARAVERGVAEIALKLRPGWGIDVLRAVRGTFPGLAIRVDFDGTASIEQRDLLFRLQDFQVTAIEQPLDADDLAGHAMLQESLRTPICLDQSITSVERARQALDMGSCQQIRISPDFCGGFHAAKEIVALCQDAGAVCVVGARSSAELSLRQAAALAMLISNVGTIEVNEYCDPADGEDQPRVILPWHEAGNGMDVGQLLSAFDVSARPEN